ncbi:hypothetical protein [Sediminibacterium sp.]|jgi:hypothetical protein|uniref:hypothetical protein n=1 Tax=Sediminibacterium sp. TaxID=1917865 RepID=UPI0025F2AA9B|nr:hypothetical protein [Sediminibacterium sp.]MBW0176373.1 hypothetical protein [Sediminibacterium sp.]
MRKKFIILIFAFVAHKCNAQQLLQNGCDTSFMGKETYQKCMEDSLYASMINQAIDHFTFIKTTILPKFRKQRRELSIPPNIKTGIIELRRIYDSTLKHKLWEINKDMNRNMKYVSPKSNILSLLAFEHFRIYPDIYAILLNEIHLHLNPVSNKANIESINKKIDFLYITLSEHFKNTLEQIYIAMRDEKSLYESKIQWRGTFQGNIPDKDRIKYGLIDFLIWDQ